MKKNVKAFLHTFLQSLLPQPQAYKKFRRLPFQTSLLYFIVLICVINALFLVFFIVKNSDRNIFDLRSSLRTSLSRFPADLYIYIHKGALTTTYDRPYFWWTTFNDKQMLLGVVDESGTADKVYAYNSLFLLTPGAITINARKIPLVPQHISLNNTTTRIDRATARRTTALIDGSFGMILAFLALTFFVLLPMVSSVMNIVLATGAATVAFLIFRNYHTNIKPLEALQTTFHAATLPLIAMYVILSISPGNPHLFLSFFLLTILFSLGALYEANYTEHHVKHRRRLTV